MSSNIPEEYCRQKAAIAGTSFYYSTLYYPKNIKRDLNAIHAFAVELEELLVECTDPGVTRMKLGWWVEETQRLIANQARHPVTRELCNLKERFPEAETVMLQLIRYHEQQVNLESPENYQVLMDFLRQGPGLIWKLTAKICGTQHSHVLDIASTLGCQFAWFNIIQNTPVNLKHNRNYWPKDELSNVTEVRKDFFAFQLQRLMKELDTGIEKLPDGDRTRQLHVLIMAQIISRTCDEIAKSGYQINTEKISLTPLRKFWIAWQIRRKNK